MIAWAVDSKTRPAASGIWLEAFRAALARRTASGPRASTCSASARAAAISSASGTTSAHQARLQRAGARPSARRSGSSPWRGPRPTMRGRRCVPPAPGMMPRRGLGQAEDGVLGRDAQVAGQGQLAAAAQRVAVDGRDASPRRGLSMADMSRELMEASASSRRRCADGVDVGAGDEGLVAGAGDDEHGGARLRAPRPARGGTPRRSRCRGRCAPRAGSR